MAQEQFNNAVTLYNKLAYCQMYNMNDGKPKMYFSMDGNVIEETNNQ